MEEKTKHIQIAEYNYPLPDERIAKFPLAERDHSKLLVYNKGAVSHDIFYNLPNYLPKGALMVYNNTKVIQARLHFNKETGALIEVFCLEPIQPNDYVLNFQQTKHCAWLCLVGNLKKWKEGTLRKEVDVKGRKVILTATRGEMHGTSHWIDFDWDDDSITFADILEGVGELPIPPYLNRKTEESDKKTYQTVYSKIKGSVAAPTAGLHFTDKVLKDIDAHGIEREEVTLHVGAGTFKPVKSEEIEGHEMHSEYIFVPKHTIERLIAHDASAIAVGTTSVRTLESLYYIGVTLQSNPDATEQDLHVNQWMPYEYADSEPNPITAMQALQNIKDYLERNGIDALHTSTQIIIAPGYDYKIVKMLVTNFHQPQSTLLLLVSAFVKGDWHKIYDYALANDFRFLSYGDSSLLIP
ncbi:MAG: S-adenosylmethionine:tRNA ribosyltransferase-isomerase [Bacteroidaceae bacterium]|nr:S-adenosylmethionine:tRNA ribosyltransferase-isomerase [Bacteroidaceae bacterium]MBR5764372.1 S-adenosylmethionine:tRNA ribosyltransferase-isomerase [Bacteroidaceae bacterium]